MAHVHEFRAELRWSGSTAGGYRAYAREHEVRIPPAEPTLAVSSAPEFRGDASHANPEQLLLAAAASCQLLSFLACAARAGIDVLDYADDARAEMPVTREPMWVTRIELRPRITVAAGTDTAAVLEAVQLGHEECFVARSLRSDVVVVPDVITVEA